MPFVLLLDYGQNDPIFLGGIEVVRLIFESRDLRPDRTFSLRFGAFGRLSLSMLLGLLLPVRLGASVFPELGLGFLGLRGPDLLAQRLRVRFAKQKTAMMGPMMYRIGTGSQYGLHNRCQSGYLLEGWLLYQLVGADW